MIDLACLNARMHACSMCAASFWEGCDFPYTALPACISPQRCVSVRDLFFLEMNESYGRLRLSEYYVRGVGDSIIYLSCMCLCMYAIRVWSVELELHYYQCSSPPMYVRFVCVACKAAAVVVVGVFLCLHSRCFLL